MQYTTDGLLHALYLIYLQRFEASIVIVMKLFDIFINILFLDRAG